MPTRKPGNRMVELEKSEGVSQVLLHVFPGETKAKARRAYEREHGPIPADARVIVIRHAFKSAI